MSPFKCYTLYVAIKNHFNSETYDYFKYNKKCRVKPETFEIRRDRFFFHKLAKKYNETELEEFFVANFMENGGMWIGDALSEDAHQVYLKWKKYRESSTYRFEEDIQKIKGKKLIHSLAPKEGYYPKLLQLYMQNEMAADSLLAVLKVAGNPSDIIGLWDKKIQDKIYWPTVKRKLLKYLPFCDTMLRSEVDKYKVIMKKVYGNEYVDKKAS